MSTFTCGIKNPPLGLLREGWLCRMLRMSCRCEFFRDDTLHFGYGVFCPEDLAAHDKVVGAVIGSERRGKDTIIYIFLISNLKNEPTPTSEIKDAVWLTKEKALDAFNAPHMKELFELGIKQ
jgi:hypothetical protein